MDASTIAAIAALVVAIIAFLVATAQATQQYFITGQNIRLCDSVVFSDMPGQGRRIWQMSQFRFRVVYSIPQISLPNDFWPRTSPISHKERRYPLPELSGFVASSKRGGRRRKSLAIVPQEKEFGKGMVVNGPGAPIIIRSADGRIVETIQHPSYYKPYSPGVSEDESPEGIKSRIPGTVARLRNRGGRQQKVTQNIVGPKTGEAAWVSYVLFL